VGLPAQLVSEALDEAVSIRKKILDLAGPGTYAAQREKELLLLDAEDALDRVRLIGDLVIGAFFGQKSDKERERERTRRLDLVERWLAAEKRGDEKKALGVLGELRGMQAEIRREQVPFHWVIEFPEVFYSERPDPLDENRVNGKAFVDAFVGNPPFMGGGLLSGSVGDSYVTWLTETVPFSHGMADLSAFFLRRCAVLLGEHGTIGLITTKTIAQGETRDTGPAQILHSGFEIYHAIRSMEWPGEAAVSIAILHAAHGVPRSTVSGGPTLDGIKVTRINSQLLAGEERGNPLPLVSNEGLFSKGVDPGGAGFVIGREEHDALVGHHERTRSLVRPYVGGDEINSRPSQDTDRFIICFTGMSLDEAKQYPDLVSIVEARVKPDRMALRDNAINRRLKERWWLYWADRPDFFAQCRELKELLCVARVTKYVAFSLQPMDRILNEKVYLFAFNQRTAFAVLQSRSHEVWARRTGSTRGDTLNYSGGACFGTFPFPEPDPRAVIPELELMGEKLYNTRARFMVDTSQGLTKTYNALKDPDNDDPRVLELRALHEEMDRAVLAAYGWSEIAVPPYCPRTDEDRAALQAFEDEVIDRLFVLNAERAAQEKQSAAPAPAKTPRKTAAKKTAEPAKKTAAKRPRGKAATLPGFESEDDA
jgi:hypothetical protein